MSTFEYDSKDCNPLETLYQHSGTSAHSSPSARQNRLLSHYKEGRYTSIISRTGCLVPVVSPQSDHVILEIGEELVPVHPVVLVNVDESRLCIVRGNDCK